MTSRHYFITGTDTGVGKSLVSSALLLRLADLGRRCVGMKPVAAGTEFKDGQWVNEDVLQLDAASNVKAPMHLRCPYSFRAAMSPHLAAQTEASTVSLAQLTSAYQQLARLADTVVIEGAGGFRVPLTQDLDGADLARALGVPMILVVGIRLGCLNHALLTQEAILARGLSLAGWVACQVDPVMPVAQANVNTLVHRIAAPLLGSIPWMPQPDPKSASTFLDLGPLKL